MIPDRPDLPSEATAPRHSSATVPILAVLLLLVAAALIYVTLRTAGTAPLEERAAEPRPITARGDLSGEEQSVIELFQQASPSVVHVTSVERREERLRLNMFDIPQGSGSGFVWDREGHIVTNFHVIQKGNVAEVTLNDNTVWKAEIVGREPDKDLAVLKIAAPPETLRPLALGTSANLQVGQKVFAIGNPFGLDQTLTTGVISGLGREILSVTKRPIQGVIQTDAAINPGNSGGPLLDSAGQLIGVNTAIYSPSGAYAGIGFAVPVDTINRIVPQLVAHGKVVRPGLGIHVGTDQLSRQLGVEGVLIIDVPAGSAAAKAGLKGIQAGPSGRWMIGDVIVSVEGETVRDSADLYRELDRKTVGDTIAFEIERDGERRPVTVELQALP